MEAEGVDSGVGRPTYNSVPKDGKLGNFKVAVGFCYHNTVALKCFRYRRIPTWSLSLQASHQTKIQPETLQAGF